MRFKVDENLPEELSRMLRNAGWDSVTVVEQQLGGELDLRVDEVCRTEHRILVTFDRGFSNIRTYPPTHRAGVIVFRLKRQDKPHVLAVTAHLIEALRQRRLEGELWIVHEDRIRIRSGAVS